MANINEKKGLRKQLYMTTDELVQWMKLGFLSGELAATVKETKDKVWHKKLATAYTLCNQVLLERLEIVEPHQLKSISRRKDHSNLLLVTSDQKRIPNYIPEEEIISVAKEDLNDLADLALNSCAACPQGECVKNCFYKNIMFRLGLPVCREEVNEGECPFNWQKVGETSQIVPHNQRISEYYDDAL